MSNAPLATTFHTDKLQYLALALRINVPAALVLAPCLTHLMQFPATKLLLPLLSLPDHFARASAILQSSVPAAGLQKLLLTPMAGAPPQAPAPSLFCTHQVVLV